MAASGIASQRGGVHASVSRDEQAGGRTGSRDRRAVGRPPASDEPKAASNLSPSGVAIEHEQSSALWRALERLPEDYRRVVCLRFDEDRSFEEIGKLTGRSPNAARKVWARAMERLRLEWENPS